MRRFDKHRSANALALALAMVRGSGYHARARAQSMKERDCLLETVFYARTNALKFPIKYNFCSATPGSNSQLSSSLIRHETFLLTSHRLHLDGGFHLAVEVLGGKYRPRLMAFSRQQ